MPCPGFWFLTDWKSHLLRGCVSTVSAHWALWIELGSLPWKTLLCSIFYPPPQTQSLLSWTSQPAMTEPRRGAMWYKSRLLWIFAYQLHNLKIFMKSNCRTGCYHNRSSNPQEAWDQQGNSYSVIYIWLTANTGATITKVLYEITLSAINNGRH